MHSAIARVRPRRQRDSQVDRLEPGRGVASQRPVAPLMGTQFEFRAARCGGASRKARRVTGVRSGRGRGLDYQISRVSRSAVAGGRGRQVGFVCTTLADPPPLALSTDAPISDSVYIVCGVLIAMVLVGLIIVLLAVTIR